jgi:transposase
MLSQNLFEQNELLKIENASLRSQSLQIAEQLKAYKSEMSYLQEQIRELKRHRFGKKSERWESQEQLVFNEAEAEVQEPGVETKTEPQSAQAGEVEVRGYKKKRGHRKPLPEALPREIVKIELPAEECFAKDGAPLKIIGWEVAEKLKYEPSKTVVLEIHRAKYGVESGDYEKTAPPEPSIVPKGIATPELLSAIVVSKYADGLPLYRMEDIFERQGIDLSRGTMARWILSVAEALQPVWNVLSDQLINSFYVACDETKVQVLKESGRKAEDKSWMIIRSTPYGQGKIVLFDYNPSRAGHVITELLAGFKGYLQCDGLNSYDVLEKEGITRLGCAMHARRRFEQAAVDGAQSGKSLGEKGLEYFKKLYDLEEEIKEKSINEKMKRRLEIAEPIWSEMKEWCAGMLFKVPAKSKIGNAFSYFINEYEYLTGYLKDGRLNIDNGFTERAIRKFAIGRNNWMFSDTTNGANASSLLYSLVITAKINNVNPYRALIKMCRQVPYAKTVEDYERLAALILSPEPIV